MNLETDCPQRSLERRDYSLRIPVGGNHSVAGGPAQPPGSLPTKGWVGRSGDGQSPNPPGGRRTGQASPELPRGDVERRPHPRGRPYITPSLQGRSELRWSRLQTQETQQVHCKTPAKPHPGLPFGKHASRSSGQAQLPSHTRNTHSHVSCVGGPLRQSLIFKKRLTMYYS